MKIETPEDLKEKCAKRKAKRLAKKGYLTKTGNPKGRPVGGDMITNALMNLSPKDKDDIVATLVDVAKDPSHRNYGHAAKIMMDRIAHISHFEKTKNSEAKNGITINISGMAKPEVIEDGDFKDVE